MWEKMGKIGDENFSTVRISRSGNRMDDPSAPKDKLKRWHDQLVVRKDFHKGQQVLLYDSKLHIFPGKLKSRWIGPYVIHEVYPNGVVELLNSKGNQSFKVNGHRLKPYIEPLSQNKEELTLLDPSHT